MKTIKVVAFFICVALASCVSTTPVSRDWSHAPIEPTWQTFTRAPIVSQQGNNYLVTDQFVIRAGQQKDYLDQIKNWKQHNFIP